MTKPTREEVEKWKYESAHSPLHDHAFENHNRLIYLADAYLAQEEELKQNCQHIMEMGKQLGILKTENQALKASMDVEYIERQAKHIQELVKENETLKEALKKILGWRERDRESMGEIIHYIEELASQALKGPQP